MRVVLDTNVLFAAFAFERGLCATILRVGVVRHRLIISEHILTELQRHLAGKSKLTAAKIEEVLAQLRQIFELVVPSAVAPGACRDPDDLAVLGTAVGGRADALVTGDKDLLVLANHAGIPILSPREFHDRFLGAIDEVVP